jgi:transcriptional regulator with XRE-family HTH domain
MKYMKPIGKMVTMLVQDCDATGLALRNMRKETGISLREVARRMNITPPYLSDLERGNRTWTDELCERFQKALRK